MEFETQQTRETGPVSLVFVLLGAAVLIVASLIGFCLCVERMVEFTNGNRIQSDWVPFRGPITGYIWQLPHALYVSFAYFTGGSFATLIFFPMLVVLVPIYDIVMYGDFTFALAVWVPMMGAVALFLSAAFFFRRGEVKLTKTLSED